jgi:DNA-binding PadR family transcriptional regulator
MKKIAESEDEGSLWESIVKKYDFIEGAQISNSFIVLLALNDSKKPLSTTQISEKISAQSKGKIFKVSGALKDSLENRLRKLGYVEGKDIPNIKVNHKRIRMTLYSITPKGRKLLKGWLGFLASVE